VQLVGFIITNFHDARSPEREILLTVAVNNLREQERFLEFIVKCTFL